MIIFQEIKEFIRKEKFYSIAALILILVYGVLIVLRPHEPDPGAGEKSKVMDAYEKAEDKMQSKIKDLGSIEAYFKDRPDLQLWMNLLSFGVMSALIAGVVLDFFFFFKRGWREKIQKVRPPPHLNWKPSLLLKFFVWFFALNIILGFGLNGARGLWGGDENFYLLLHTTLAEIISFAVMVVLIQRQGADLKALGFWVPDGNWFREIRAGWLGYLALLPLFGLVLAAVMGIAHVLHYEPPPHPLVPILLGEDSHNPFLIYYSLFLAAIFGPVFEEIFFRGFLYPILKQRAGMPVAMVISASFFALIHDSTFAFWPIFVLGLGLVYLYEKRGSLLASLTLHITHNIIFLSYFFFTKSILSRELGG